MKPEEFRNVSFWIMLLLLTASSCNRTNKQSGQDEYTCPMHPTVIQDRPGSCPVCAMDLVKKGLQGEEVKITAALNYLLKPTNAVVIATVATVMPEQKSMEVTSKASGIITYDTRRIASIPIRFGGRIEQLFVRYNFQPIQKGQKLLEIYSPELLTAQRDLSYLLKSDKDNVRLIDGAKEKLRLLGVSNVQIEQLVSTGKESYSFSVFSPVDGYVVEAGAPPISSPTQSAAKPGMNGGMGGAGTSQDQQPLAAVAGSELLTREGMYVTAGQVIFKVVNTEYVWAEFDVYQQDAAFVKVNDPVQIVLDNPVEEVKAKVDFVQPFFKNGENFTKVRVYLKNTGKSFSIGQLVTASFTTVSQPSMWIPLSARLDLGMKEIVFVKRRDVFRPREIVTARQSGDWIEVLSGVDAHDSLTYNAQFMVDSESFIKVKN